MDAIIGAPYLHICPEQTRLLDLRSEAAVLYARAASHLAAYNRVSDPPGDYKVRSDAVAECRGRLALTRDEYASHCRKHGCLSASS
jgi:hypothetical protein